MILLSSLALASGLVLVVREDNHAFNKAIPRAQITDKDGKNANLNMIDQGAPPDKVAADGIWTGETRDAGAGPFTLLISDGGDVLRWTGTFAGAGDDPAVLTLRVAPGGVVEALPADSLPFVQPTATTVVPAPLAGEQTVSGAAATPGAANPTSTPTAVATPTTAVTADTAVLAFTRAPTFTRVLAWSALVAAGAWLASGGRRLGLLALEARTGTRPALVGRGLVRVKGEPAPLVTALAGPCRVLVVGAVAAPEVPDGCVFDAGVGRVRVDDLIGLVREMERQGPPLVLVLAGALEGAAGETGDTVLALVARALPRGMVAYAFVSEGETHRVDAAGVVTPVPAPGGDASA